MKVCILTVQVPFITGGAESLSVALKKALEKRSCPVELVSIPFKWYPPHRLMDCMLMARLVDLTEVNGTKIDRLITLKFPAYFASHPHNVCWMLHQHRQAYDLYGTPMSDLWQTDAGRQVAAEVKRWDDFFLPKTEAIFTISKRVSERLSTFNQIPSTPLYPPLEHEDFRSGSFDKYIFYPGRVDPMKRQHLIVEAFNEIPGDLKLVLCGQMDTPYAKALAASIQSSPLAPRIKMLGRITHEEKVGLYANCLAVYNGVLDEDYGYVTLEAFRAGKPVITHTDSGGPLEFVVDGENGYVTAPNSTDLANSISHLLNKPGLARTLGKNGAETLAAGNISWDHVVDRLLNP